MDRQINILLLAATACAIAAAIFLAVWPSYSDGRSLAEVNGSHVYLVLAGLVLVVSLPGRVPVEYRQGLSLAVGVGLAVFSFVTTIGVFFLPAGALLLVAAWLVPGQRA